MSCRCVVLQGVEDGEEVRAKARVRVPSSPSNSISRPPKCIAELLFPVSAMGSLRQPDADSRTVSSWSDAAGDPIWDAIHAEAK